LQAPTPHALHNCRPQTGDAGDRAAALDAFAAERDAGEEDAASDADADAAAEEEPDPPPFLASVWPADKREQRAFLERTAASWSLIALVLVAYVLLLTAMGQGAAVYLALRPAVGWAKARARQRCGDSIAAAAAAHAQSCSA
jgi:hypothetical protein